MTSQIQIENNSSNKAENQLDYSIVLAGHGSRDQNGVDEFKSLASIIKGKTTHPVYESFLEFAQPTIDEAIRQAVSDGAQRIVVVPALLTAAMHAKNDMPGELHAMQSEFPEVKFHFGAALDLHPQLLNICREKIIEAEAKSSNRIKRADTCLVVVGRGTSDPDANSDMSKLCRMLEEGLGFGTSFVCYAGTALPLVKDGLNAAARLGYKRIVVLPYFLFDGVLVKRIYEAADVLQSRKPEIEVLKTSYLGVDPRIAEVFLDRALEGVEGRAHMNCSLCKYRVQIVGFESQLGAPQQAHHLRVKGNATSATKPGYKKYVPHPIEAESFSIIAAQRDWSHLPESDLSVIQRLVHTTGDINIDAELFFSPGAVETGIRSLLRTRTVVTDVTMVEAGIKRALKSELGIRTWCGVHDKETELMAEQFGMTRSAAGIRRASEIFGNDLVLAIGDAPTAVMEAVDLVKNHGWRPQLIVGLPVGFVGTNECKEELRRCLHIPRITNKGTRGGSPWAAAVINALLIGALNSLAEDQ
jgi:precorrin-8X/cobalt-precorrin-8 methylmutase